jgi:hypothetical protein
MEKDYKIMGKWISKLIEKHFSKDKTPEVVLSEKDKATARGEPFVRVINVNFDPENPGDGYFELEWNQIFIRQLLESGYSGQTEEEIIDSWFTNLCRNIAAEV